MPKVYQLLESTRHSSKSKRITVGRLLFFFVISATLLSNQTKAQTSNSATKDIVFKSEGIKLAGSIFHAKQPHAAIVLVHGSGQEKRMTELASSLAQQGISVLTYDKRGVGKSGGTYAGPEVGTNNIDSANLSLLAKDVQAATEILRQEISYLHIPIGLLGFSQAGWIIPLATDKKNTVDFFVLFSGAVVPTREQLRFQFFTNGDNNFWDKHTEREARQHIMNDPDRYQFVTTDPQKSLGTQSVPGLWLFGAKDIQIPVGLSLEHLNALKVQGKPYDYCVFPDLGHNTSLSASNEPTAIALQWIKNRSLQKALLRK